ncbi:MAG: glycogen debranching N-terminal domain-containing protein [Thermoleophilia bacterium]
MARSHQTHWLARPDGTPEIHVGPGAVVAIAGLSFAISDERGDLGDANEGLLVRDTRHLSRMELRFDGAPMRSLGVGLLGSHRCDFRGYLPPRPGSAALDAPWEVERDRRMTPDGLTETVTLRARDHEEPVRVDLHLAADFADIFEVRRLQDARGLIPSRRVHAQVHPGMLELTAAGGLSTTVEMDPPPERIDRRVAQWTARPAPDRPWVLRVRVTARVRGVTTGDRAGPSPVPAHGAGHPAPVVTVPEGLARAAAASLADLEALTLPDPLEPGRRIVTAGIPWFVALFGRDSLIAAHEARIADPGLMLETLHALAARQGRVRDPANDEAPGKILHEVRLTPRPWLGEGTAGGARPYYGSVDATPLFLIMLGEAHRWGASPEELMPLMPAAEAALAWLRGPDADPDGDGLVEYAATGPRSLANQGWKDSENAVQFADGRLAEPPIAMAEVQGYAFRARKQMAEVLAAFGRDGEAQGLVTEADALRSLVRERYWIPGDGDRPGYFAMALDGAKRPVDGVASNLGHLLWCGVPSNDEAAAVARHLDGPEMSSGWGLRTLSAASAGFNPISYHAGSVWPHDTMFAIQGLRRYGHDAEAMRLAAGLIDACAVFEDRLPELFGGHPRDVTGFPIPYPTACRPQAWSAGVPLALIACMLGLEPDIPNGVLSLAPALPVNVASLQVAAMRFPQGELSIAIDHDGARLLGQPAGLRIEFRPPAGP